ncbi:hypothetical protein R3P38DRAFT_473664 [Favolaschia claudopus]|uniref:Uncharacterized protein n=1 Tax=Favolaschia claudopus TaxID=2862362 RepID=A0AAW0CJW8_9AGAR
MEFVPPPPREVIDIDDDNNDSAQLSSTSGPGGGLQGPSAADNAENVISDFESDDEDQREVDHKPLISPSTDIKGDFENALEDNFYFDGVFAYSQRYDMGVAPNPCLKIDGLGTVGIPLSERDARAIISASAPVIGTNNDTKTSGMWELPSEKVHFDNSAWGTWIDGTAGTSASKALTATSIKPSFTLKKLVVHEQSSHTTRHRDPIVDDESNPKIGDLIVVLPSHFEGGQLQLRHSGQVKSLNFAHQSGLSTSVAAAYSGVEHTLAGVSSGYRLSLVYDIVQPITHLGVRPTLPEMQGAASKLHRVMRSWKENPAEGAPQLLACLLQHKYPKSLKFSAKSLTGSDALLVSHLRPLARELQFRLYLAHVRVTVSTPSEALGYDGDDYGYGGYGYGGWGRRRRYCAYDEYDEDDIDSDAFEDIEDEREVALDVVQVVDVRGMPVAVNFDLEEEDIINGSILNGDPDEESLDRDDRTTATRREVYNRTVLLVWQKDSDVDMRVAIGDVYDYCCHGLKKSLTTAPTKREKALVKDLLACSQIRPNPQKLPTVIQVLRESADRWNDAQLLIRALKACKAEKNIDILGLEGFVSSYQAFGWDVLREFCEQSMAGDESNARRQALLARLTQMGKDEQDEQVAAWCKEQVEVTLRSLKKVDAAQIPWLANLGLSRGGEFLRDVIFPQLEAQKLDKTFWIPFLQELQRNMNNAPTASPEIVKGLLSKCVTETVRNLPAFPTKTITPTYAYGVPREEKSSGAILEVVQLCVSTQNLTLCTEIFAKMRNSARCGSYPSTFPPWMYYAELSPSLVQLAQTPAVLNVFQPFFVDVIVALVSAARKSPTGTTITPCPLSDTHKTVIVNAARKAGGVMILKQHLTAENLKGHDSSTMQALVRTVAKEFPRQQLQEDAQQAYSALLITLVRIAIDSFRLPSAQPTYGGYGVSYGYARGPSDQLLDMVKFCFEVGAKSQCQRLLLRSVTPPKDTTVAQHVSKVLTPFLPVLRQFLVSKRLDFQAEPYKMFAAAVVKAYAEHVMKQKPTEVVPIASLEKIGCQACADCRELKAFFLSDRAETSFSRVQGIRTHLERQLHSTRGWGVTWTTLKYGSPHTLKVTKPASMTAVGLWAANSQAGKTLLANLGDATTQAQILGNAYSVVHARIYGTNPPPLPAAAPLANSNQVPKRPATNAPGVNPVAKKPRMST